MLDDAIICLFLAVFGEEICLMSYIYEVRMSDQDMNREIDLLRRVI